MVKRRANKLLVIATAAFVQMPGPLGSRRRLPALSRDAMLGLGAIVVVTLPWPVDHPLLVIIAATGLSRLIQDWDSSEL